VNPGLLATGAEALTAEFVVSVQNPWAAQTAYNTGQTVAFDDAVWLASWWTKNQQPGDPNGPWQKIVAQDGTAVWTASRIFQAGDEVTHSGTTYVAKWWTRNQTPGDANGPWKVVTG
jgi:chitodextrinase